MTADLTGLRERERETLAELDYVSRDGEWARPMDVGGHNRSHHSATLAKLVRLGLAERRQRSAWMSRGSWIYRATPAGRRALSAESPAGKESAP